MAVIHTWLIKQFDITTINDIGLPSNEVKFPLKKVGGNVK